jgi:hypothetical protein
MEIVIVWFKTQNRAKLESKMGDQKKQKMERETRTEERTLFNSSTEVA